MEAAREARATSESFKALCRLSLEWEASLIIVFIHHRPSNYRRRFVAAKEISVKKYVVKLTGDERRHLHELIRTGKHSAQL